MTECSETGDRLTRLEALFHAYDKAHSALHTALEKVEARDAELLKERLERMNEFRDEARTVQQTYVRDDVYRADAASLAKSVSTATDRIGSLEGRFLGIGLMATVLSAVALVVALVKG